MALAVLAGTAGTAQANFVNGNDLLKRCNDPQAPFYCGGFVSGAHDGFTTAWGWSKQAPMFCVPTGVSIPQLVDITVAYLEDHPETRHYAASELIGLAIREAFPCK